MKTVLNHHNITISIEHGEDLHKFNMYSMAPDDADEMIDTVSRFNRGFKEDVQDAVNQAVYLFLEENDQSIDFDMMPDVAYKFDRKRQEAIVKLSNGSTLNIRLSVE